MWGAKRHKSSLTIEFLTGDNRERILRERTNKETRIERKVTRTIKFKFKVQKSSRLEEKELDIEYRREREGGRRTQKLNFQQILASD